MGVRFGRIERVMAKILLVEDEVFLVELYYDLLTGEGYEVDKATDGEQALEKMKQGGYDLVLLDLIIPKLGGYEVLEKLKNDPPLKENKALVFMTNLGKDSVARDGQLYQSKGVIVKSNVDPGEFLLEVKKYLGTINN